DTNNALNATGAGAASFSDTNGNLLVYTNGLRLYNKNHILTPNGNNPFNIISSHAKLAMLVQHPSNNSILYCFVTVSSINVNNFKYLLKFEIDLTLDNGLGDIVIS